MTNSTRDDHPPSEHHFEADREHPWEERDPSRNSVTITVFDHDGEVWGTVDWQFDPEVYKGVPKPNGEAYPIRAAIAQAEAARQLFDVDDIRLVLKGPML